MLEQKKLEELMYLSLIGDFAYKQVKDSKTYIAFKSEMNKGNTNIKPIYLTSVDVGSERLQKARITSFEQKIFNEKTLKAIENYSCGEINYLRRITIFLSNNYQQFSTTEQKKLLDNFSTNMWGLYSFSVVNDRERKACIKYMKQEIKIREDLLIK